MSEKKGFKWLEKLKHIKHIEIYIALIFLIIILLIYFSTTSKADSQKKVNEESNLTINSYIENLENNLAEILSNINGVQNVKVMITLDMQQVSISNSTLSYESFPPIKGIIVTANGMSNTANKLKVLHAIETVVDVTSGNIQILSSD